MLSTASIPSRFKVFFITCKIDGSIFLGDPEEIKKLMEAVANQGQK